MNTNLAKVTKIHDDFEFERVMKFINIKGIRSKRTPDDYLRDIRHFFKSEKVKGKELEYIRTSDLMISNDIVYDYVMELLDSGLKKVSVLRKIASVRSFYNYLEVNDYPVNPKWFKIDEVKNDDNEEYDALTWEEVEQMIEIVKPTRKGDMKALLIETAVVTGFRYEALMALSEDSLEFVDGVWTLKTDNQKDKWNKVNQNSIRDDLRDRLLELSKKYNLPNKRFFALTKKSIGKMIRDCCEQMGIDRTKRRIVFHSFKKTGVTEVFMITNGDVKAIQEQGHHEDPRTALATYVKLKKDFSQSPSLMIGNKIEEKEFESITLEQYVEVMKKLDRATQFKVLNALREIQ